MILEKTPSCPQSPHSQAPTNLESAPQQGAGGINEQAAAKSDVDELLMMLHVLHADRLLLVAATAPLIARGAFLRLGAKCP